ncbi:MULTISPECIES: hypothetical protein [Candidatus Ichthyocystis]|nr:MULTISPECIES: hypothetical protein [Ichthyocystis]
MSLLVLWGNSSLETAAQDMDGSSKSGAGSRPSRGSLTSPDIKTPQGFR